MKWMVVCIIGLTAAAVMASAVLFVSRRGSLLPSSEPLPLVRFSMRLVFVFQGDVELETDYCWSRSYNNKDRDWKPCKPKGYGTGGWTEYVCYAVNDNCVGLAAYVNECGLPCTEFESLNFDGGIYNTIVRKFFLSDVMVVINL